MIHNYGDHGYCSDQNHWIMRNYDLFFLDHGFTRIMTTWSQELLRSKPWDHGIFDLGSKKMQIVRSRDHIFDPFFLIQSIKITDIRLPKISGSRHLMIQNWVIRSNNNWTHLHISFSCCGFPTKNSTSKSVKNQTRRKWGRCQSSSCIPSVQNKTRISTWILST